MNKLTQKFGRKLIFLRHQRGYSQEDLAEKSGISVDFISLIERGLRAPSFKTLEKLSEALDTSVDKLFDFREEE